MTIACLLRNTMVAAARRRGVGACFNRVILRKEMGDHGVAIYYLRALMLAVAGVLFGA